jgi:hypothetical protein
VMGSVAPRLHPEDLAILADLIAERLADRLEGGVRPPPQLVDANAIARRFGVSVDWVYEHANTLGVVRLGDGPKARLRFNPEKVAEALGAGGRSAQPTPPTTAPGRRRQRRKAATSGGASLLPYKAEEQ